MKFFFSGHNYGDKRGEQLLVKCGMRHRLLAYTTKTDANERVYLPMHRSEEKRDE